MQKSNSRNAEKSLLSVSRWKGWARAWKGELLALYFAYRDPRMPWFAKLTAIAVVAYAVSPIDLIPDFIPVLGYLDDLLIVPLGIYITIQLTPKAVLSDAREKARERVAAKEKIRLKKGWISVLLILAIWLLLFFALTILAVRMIKLVL